MNHHSLRYYISLVEETFYKDLTLYHGTNQDIDRIDITKLGRSDPGFIGRAFYLTGNKKRAEAYARGSTELYGGKPHIITFKASPEKTLILESTGAGEVISKLRDLGANTDVVSNPTKISRFLVEQGYDSAIVIRGGNIFEFAVYDTNIIKKIDTEVLS